MRNVSDLEGFKEGKPEPATPGHMGNCSCIHGMECRSFHLQRDSSNGGSRGTGYGNALEIRGSSGLRQGMEEIRNRLSLC